MSTHNNCFPIIDQRDGALIKSLLNNVFILSYVFSLTELLMTKVTEVRLKQ